MGGSESKQGYQVSRVLKHSPAHNAGLVPFFDFIVAAGKKSFEENDSFFKDYLQGNIGKPIELTVYNARCRSVRDVLLTPSNTWGGKGLLGCSISWETVEDAFQTAWRVLEVAAGSNAAAASLRPFVDHIIGMQQPPHREMPESNFVTMFTDDDDFTNRCQKFLSAAKDHSNPRFGNFCVLVMVFDSSKNTIREIQVTLPLGCNVATGAIHTIPCAGNTDPPTIIQFVSDIFAETLSGPETQPNQQQQHTQPQPQSQSHPHHVHLPPPHAQHGAHHNANAHPVHLPSTFQTIQQHTQQHQHWAPTAHTQAHQHTQQPQHTQHIHAHPTHSTSLPYTPPVQGGAPAGSGFPPPPHMPHVGAAAGAGVPHPTAHTTPMPQMPMPTPTGIPAPTPMGHVQGQPHVGVPAPFAAAPPVAGGAPQH